MVRRKEPGTGPSGWSWNQIGANSHFDASKALNDAIVLIYSVFNILHYSL